MARGSVHKRCRICRQQNKSGWESCSHREAVYLIRYRVGNQNKSETIGANKKDAEKRLAEVLSQLNNGTYGNQKEITFNEFVDKWLRDCAKPRIRRRTYTSYESAIRRHLKPTLGNKYLKQITMENVQALMAKMRENYSAKTANNLLKLLKTIFKYARRWKYIIEDVTLDVDNFRVEFKEMDFLKPEEITKLLNHAREPYKTLILTAILTGMRKSEILALQWGDIDWNSNTIFVRRSLHWDYKGQESERKWWFDSPKTRNSVRAIVMSPKLKEALEIHRLSQIENESDLVFTNSEGNPLDPNNLVKRGFHPALACAGLRKIRFHDLRHSYASLLIDQNESIKFIQGQLGHASAQTTLDRYGHIMPVCHNDMGARLDMNVFGGSENAGRTEYPLKSATTMKHQVAI